MVSGGAGAAGPELLACGQLDPHGLERRLSSRELVRSAVPHYCLGGCSALFVCVRRSRQIRGDGTRAGSPSPSPLFPASLVPLAVRVAGCPVRVSLSFACWYAIPCGLCIPGARSSCPSGLHRVLVCVCARAPAVCTLSPLVGPTCALRAVPVQGAGKAVPGGSCPSTFPALMPCFACLVCGGVSPVPASPSLAPGRSPPRG